MFTASQVKVECRLRRSRRKHQAAESLVCIQVTGKFHAPLKEELPLFAIDVTKKHSDVIVICANSDIIIVLIVEVESSIDTSSTYIELIVEEPLEEYCKAVLLKAGHDVFKLHAYQRELIIRKSIVDESIRFDAPSFF